MEKRSAVIFVLSLLIFSATISACGGSDDEELTLAPESALPEFVQDAPPQVREAYRFAIANPDVLKDFPCYCGCGSMGHESNLGCYVKETRPDGTLVFENHALG
jgi:hypothetical protein